MIRAVCKFEAPGKRPDFEDWNFAAVPSIGHAVHWEIRGAWRVDAVTWRKDKMSGAMLPTLTLSPIGDAQ